MRQSIRCPECQELVPLPSADEFRDAMGSLYEQAIEERDQSRAEVERAQADLSAEQAAHNESLNKTGAPPEPCPHCDGEGVSEPGAGLSDPCPHCHGEGVISDACPTCHGTGVQKDG